MKCPHCNRELTDEEVKKLWAQRNGKKQTPHPGPGRPKGSKNKSKEEQK